MERLMGKEEEYRGKRQYLDAREWSGEKKYSQVWICVMGRIIMGRVYGEKRRSIMKKKYWQGV